MNNVSRFNKVQSPCFSASHIVEMRDALNTMARQNNNDPRNIEISMTLHELNILVGVLEAR